MSLQTLTAASLLADGARLLAAIAGDSRISFQTFDETGRSRQAKILHGTLAQHAEEMAALNRTGASINFMVNHGDGRGRAAGNVLAVRALFVDLDGAPLEPVRSGALPPHAIVQSSIGKYHAYWLVDGVELADFKPLQQAIAAAFNGDTKVSDLGRVMRLPGSFHCKAEPVLCELMELSDHRRYCRAEVVDAFGISAAPANRTAPKLKLLDGSIPEGERNATLFDLARGFVNKGFGPEQVLARIQAVNANKCAVPLCATEVDAIVASAARHGPAGFLNLPLQVFDSEVYRQLSHAARTLASAAYRRYNGENNGDIALSFSDFPMEFSRKETFYAARAELVVAGLLTRARKRCYIEGIGWRPDLYEVALSPPGGPNQERSAVN